MKKTAFICNSPANIDRVYGEGRKDKIAEISELYPTIITSENINEHVDGLKNVEAAFSTWGMPNLTPDQLDCLPALKVLLYSAGSVKGFAEPLLDRGIAVMSAWWANGVPVAEYTLAQIILSNKGYFRNTRACKSYETRREAPRGPGNFGETVAILGAGAIGQTLIGLLKSFNLKVIVWDPFLRDEKARELGVEKISTLMEAFQRGLVVTNHLANVPGTRGLLTGEMFAGMRQGATFINTGRGATVVEQDMIKVLKERDDLTALLDVTDPEPPAPDSPLYSMPNVHLTTHIAGSLGDEVWRMADYAIEEFLAWEQGKNLKYSVTREMLLNMA